MSASYSASVVAGVFLARGKATSFVTRYNEETGEPYDHEVSRDVLLIGDTDIEFTYEGDELLETWYEASRSGTLAFGYTGAHAVRPYAGVRVVRAREYNDTPYIEEFNIEDCYEALSTAKNELFRRFTYEGPIGLHALLDVSI